MKARSDKRGRKKLRMMFVSLKGQRSGSMYPPRSGKHRIGFLQRGTPRSPGQRKSLEKEGGRRRQQPKGSVRPNPGPIKEGSRTRPRWNSHNNSNLAHATGYGRCVGNGKSLQKRDFPFVFYRLQVTSCRLIFEIQIFPITCNLKPETCNLKPNALHRRPPHSLPFLRCDQQGAQT